MPHLERQIFSALHLRLLKSRNKAGVMELARTGQTVEKPIDPMKSPIVLDFLGLQGSPALRESDIESAIISKLSRFLLELGKGFAFVARQKRITFEDEDFFIDLVFYNIILKCHLLVDLKLGKLTHQDVGQMYSYVRLFDAQGRTSGDGPTIGLILCAEKNEAMARYSILREHEQLFAAKYVTYLPSEEELRQELERDRRSAARRLQRPPPRAAPRHHLRPRLHHGARRRYDHRERHARRRYTSDAWARSSLFAYAGSPRAIARTCRGTATRCSEKVTCEIELYQR